MAHRRLCIEHSFHTPACIEHSLHTPACIEHNFHTRLLYAFHCFKRDARILCAETSLAFDIQKYSTSRIVNGKFSKEKRVIYEFPQGEAESSRLEYYT